MNFKPLVIEKLDEVENAFFSGRCDAYTTDRSGLAATRAGKAPNPDDYIILPEVISKEPLAPAVRHGDDEWFDIVKWTVFAHDRRRGEGHHLQDRRRDAEERRSRGQAHARRRRRAWARRSISTRNGLYNIVKQVGNYGEIFERNVGKDSPLKLERGLNALWTKGGLMYAMPFR